MELVELASRFVALVGVGGLIALLVNVLKVVGWAKEGTIPTWTTGLNLAGLVILFVLQVFVPNADITKLDGIAATIAQVGMLLLGLITQVFGSKLAHKAFRGTWLIGKSFSFDRGISK